MNFLTGFAYRNLYSFVRFPGDSAAFVSLGLGIITGCSILKGSFPQFRLPVLASTNKFFF